MTMRAKALMLIAGLALSGCAGTDSAPERARHRVSQSQSAETQDVPPAATEVRAAQTRDRTPTRSDLIGAWEPISVRGEDASSFQRTRGTRPLLTFDEYTFGLGWRAFNGCQWESGRARLDASGGFSTSHRGSDLNGCIGPEGHHIATADVVSGANRLGLSGMRLRFYDSRGGLLGLFVRTHRSP